MRFNHTAPCDYQADRNVSHPVWHRLSGGARSLAPNHPTSSRRAAFSLIEVNMALLVVGIGLAALLGLFPAALRESSLAAADTSQAMFADQVLNMLHANASAITNWSNWNSQALLTNRADTVNDDVCVPDSNNNYIPVMQGLHIVTNYLTKGTFIKYNLTLELAPDATNNLIRAWLRVGDRKATDISKNPIYITEFVFMGM